MMKLKQIVAVAAMGLMTTGIAYASDEEEMSKLDKALKKYERTGEMKRCLNPTRIRQSRVVDDNHIIFEISSRKVYLMTLPRKCPRLGFHRAIKYDVRGGSICKSDLFEVFDSMGIRGPNCSFGEFERLTRKKDKKPEAAAE